MKNDEKKGKKRVFVSGRKNREKKTEKKAESD